MKFRCTDATCKMCHIAVYYCTIPICEIPKCQICGNEMAIESHT
jgi:hypothetical protein